MNMLKFGLIILFISQLSLSFQAMATKKYIDQSPDSSYQFECYNYSSAFRNINKKLKNITGKESTDYKRLQQLKYKLFISFEKKCSDHPNYAAETKVSCKRTGEYTSENPIFELATSVGSIMIELNNQQQLGANLALNYCNDLTSSKSKFHYICKNLFKLKHKKRLSKSEKKKKKCIDRYGEDSCTKNYKDNGSVYYTQKQDFNPWPQVISGVATFGVQNYIPYMISTAQLPAYEQQGKYQKEQAAFYKATYDRRNPASLINWYNNDAPYAKPTYQNNGGGYDWANTPAN